MSIAPGFILLRTLHISDLSRFNVSSINSQQFFRKFLIFCCFKALYSPHMLISAYICPSVVAHSPALTTNIRNICMLCLQMVECTRPSADTTLIIPYTRRVPYLGRIMHVISYQFQMNYLIWLLVLCCYRRIGHYQISCQLTKKNNIVNSIETWMKLHRLLMQ